MIDTPKQYPCPVCGLHYRDETTAQACEAFCKEHNACSLEIIRQAIESETKES